MAGQEASEAQHGRHAERPAQIPRQGWLDILKRVKKEMDRDHVSLIAAGVAFYGVLAIFPAILALTSLWALLFDPQQMIQQIETISHLLPEEAASIITEQTNQAGEDAQVGISLAAIGGILLAVYSASKGMKGLMEGLNIVYDEEEQRGLIKETMTRLLLTLGAIAMTLVTLGAVAAIPLILEAIGLDNTLGTVIGLGRWPLLLIMVMLALAVLYRYAPDRSKPHWQWASAGSALAVLVWIAGSVGFSLYVHNFGNYNETYGSLGAVIILLLWFWLSAFIVLMGAELNSEMERQTRHDTTEGGREPLGERDAYAADTVGRARK